MHQEKDNTTFKRIQDGDIALFEKIFKDYYPLLCHYSVQFVKTKEQAEEIVQELFYQLWKNKEKMKIHTSFNAYLYKATYLNSMSFIRQRSVRKRYEETTQEVSEEGISDTAFEQKELNEIIKNTLEDLPERGREIFALSRFEGMKYHEIADHLAISVKTVEANMSKALKLFRTNLKDYVGMFLL